MEKIHLKNPTGDSHLSFAFAEFLAAAKSQGIQVEVLQESDNTKGELIRELIIAIGGGVVTNAIYDLLKYSLNRLGDQLSGDTPIEIDQEVKTVEEVRKDS